MEQTKTERRTFVIFPDFNPSSNKMINEVSNDKYPSDDVFLFLFLPFLFIFDFIFIHLHFRFTPPRDALQFLVPQYARYIRQFFFLKNYYQHFSIFLNWHSLVWHCFEIRTVCAKNKMKRIKIKNHSNHLFLCFEVNGRAIFSQH